MNTASKHAVASLLLIATAGCADKKAQSPAPPAQAQAPSLNAGKAGALYPPPLTQAQTQTQQTAPPPPPEVAQEEPEPTPPPTPPPAAKSTSHKSKTPAAKAPPGSPAAAETAPPAQGATTTTNSSTEAPADVAANAEPTAASPIGELTTGDTAGQAQKGKETSDIISNTESGLNSIKRPLSSQEQETMTQIRTFLTKAKTALSNQDYDGAYILATKAKVLLDELNKA